MQGLNMIIDTKIYILRKKIFLLINILLNDCISRKFKLKEFNFKIEKINLSVEKLFFNSQSHFRTNFKKIGIRNIFLTKS